MIFLGRNDFVYGSLKHLHCLHTVILSLIAFIEYQASS